MVFQSFEYAQEFRRTGGFKSVKTVAMNVCA